MPSHGRDMVELSVTISFYKLLHLVPLNLDPLTMPLLSRASSPQPSLISTCPSVELTLQASPTFIVLLSTRLPDGFALPPWSTTTLFLKACRFFFFSQIKVNSQLSTVCIPIHTPIGMGPQDPRRMKWEYYIALKLGERLAQGSVHPYPYGIMCTKIGR